MYLVMNLYFAALEKKQQFSCFHGKNRLCCLFNLPGWNKCNKINISESMVNFFAACFPSFRPSPPLILCSAGFFMWNELLNSCSSLCAASVGYLSSSLDLACYPHPKPLDIPTISYCQTSPTSILFSFIFISLHLSSHVSFFFFLSIFSFLSSLLIVVLFHPHLHILFPTYVFI